MPLALEQPQKEALRRCWQTLHATADNVKTVSIQVACTLDLRSQYHDVLIHK